MRNVADGEVQRRHRFSEIPAEARGRPGLDEIRCGRVLLKVGIVQAAGRLETTHGEDSSLPLSRQSAEEDTSPVVTWESSTWQPRAGSRQGMSTTTRTAPCGRAVSHGRRHDRLLGVVPQRREQDASGRSRRGSRWASGPRMIERGVS